MLFAVPVQALFGQLLIGLINGSFYALLSLGLAIIFGLLNVVNFAHGALYMLGAFVAWFLSEKGGTSIAVLEARAISAGSTSRSAAAFRQQFSSRAHVRMSLFSRRVYEQFPATFGVPPVFVQNGYLFLYSQPDAMEAS